MVRKSRRSENDDWGRNGTIYSYLFLWWQGNSWKEFSLPLVTCIKWKYKENQEQKMVHCQHCHRVWTVWVKKAKIKKYTVAHFQCNPRETILIAFKTRYKYFYNITKSRIQLAIIYLICSYMDTKELIKSIETTTYIFQLNCSWYCAIYDDDEDVLSNDHTHCI